ncbi:MAG: response regulator [Treponema sp.]|jgi:signal transduction histidine kinase/CheY-like chemotaxis protein|nr:response regulator [Treponema sp.]
MKLRDIIKLNYQQILFVILAFGIMVVVSYLYASSIVRGQLFINGETAIESANIRIQAELTQAGIFLENICFFLKTMLDAEQSQDAITQMFERFTLWGAEDRGPNGLDGIYGYIQGKFFTGTNWIPPEDYDPTSRPWYTGADAQNGKLYYTDPYIDRLTGVSIVSISQKLMDKNGGLVGIIAMDINISQMLDFVKDLSLTDTGYGLVLDNAYNIVIHGLDDRWQDQSFSAIGPEYVRVTEALKQNDTISGMQFTNIYEVESILFFKKLFNNWHIGLVTPTRSYYRSVYQMALVLSLLGLVLVTILCYFLVRLYTEKISSEEKNRSKSNFLAKMSHEIRTPMNAIVGMAELILREPISREVYDHAMGIKQASANLLSIINDILDFSKIESGKMEILKTPYLLASVINDVVTIIRMRLSEKSVVFLVNIDPRLPNKLKGDEVRIRQIVLNLLNNAVKYTEQGSITLTITGDIREDHVLLRIAVEDTGIGIKQENFHRIFGDFNQFDQEKNRGIEGTGLGLAISKNLCEAMGGEIDFTSVYSQGSTFTISIPQGISDSEPLAVVQNPETKPVLLYTLNTPYTYSLIQSLEELGVRVALVKVQSDFYDALKGNTYPFIVVSPVLYAGAQHILQRMGLQSKLIMMLEYGSEMHGPEVATLAMPAHVISLADLLNHQTGDSQYQDTGDTGVRFIAPSARILLVDDIVTNLKVAEGLMAPFKMQVDTCTTGPEAIDLVRLKPYDIVFMDHMMPDMDGIEATTIIRNLEGKGTYYKELPIIALTANAVSGVKEMFLQNGMSDFLSKPIEISRLNALLQKWIPEEKQEKGRKEEKEEGPVFLSVEDTSPPQEREDAVLIIEGVAVSQGIEMTGGSLESYREILGIFLEEGREKISQLNACLDAGDTGLYTIYVHAIKSSAATIGAEGIADRAKALEAAGRIGDIPYIDQHHKPFIDALTRLLDDILRALREYHPQGAAPEDAAADDTGEAALDRAVLRQELEALQAALDRLDAGKADELIIRLQRDPWGEPIQSGIAHIARHILLSDYDEALTVIEMLLAASNGGRLQYGD